MVTVSEETTVDYELTARIATEAFAQDRIQFSPERIKWLYERGFSRGATVLPATTPDGVDSYKIAHLTFAPAEIA